MKDIGVGDKTNEKPKYCFKSTSTRKVNNNVEETSSSKIMNFIPKEDLFEEAQQNELEYAITAEEKEKERMAKRRKIEENQKSE